MSESPTIQIDQIFEPIQQEDTQHFLAEQAETFLFPDQQAKQNTAKVVAEFIDDYLLKGRDQPIDQWLLNRFRQYPDVWQSEQEMQQIANTIISTIDHLVDNQLHIESQLQKGKSLPNILNKKIEQLAEQHHINPQEIQQALDESLQQGNTAHFELYSNNPLQPLPPITTVGTQATREIIEKLKLNANLNLAWYGAKSIGERLFNSLMGKENRSREEELSRIIRSAVESAENKGVQVAVSGGLVVSAKKGWVKGVFDTVEKIENAIERARETVSRVEDLVLNVADGWNDLRLLDRVEQGLLLHIDVLAEKAKFTTAKVITKMERNVTYWLETKGTALGSKAGALLGSLFGPAGTAIGSTVGGFLGNAAGKWVGDKVVKPLAETTRKVAHTAIDTVKDVAKSVVSKTKEVFEDTWTAVKESKLNPLNWL